MQQSITDFIDALTDPIIIYPPTPSGWENTVPQELLSRVRDARLIQVMKGIPEVVSDVEALAYMYPRTLEAPMSHDWAEIYCYLASSVYQARIPDDDKITEITSYQREMLDGLKRFISKARSKASAKRQRDAKKAANQ